MYTESRNPGKFEGCASEWLGRILHDVAGNGGCSDETVSLDEWYGLVKGRRRAWIVMEDGFGYWDYREFEDHDSAKAEWNRII